MKVWRQRGAVCCEYVLRSMYLKVDVDAMMRMMYLWRYVMGLYILSSVLPSILVSKPVSWRCFVDEAFFSEGLTFFTQCSTERIVRARNKII